MVATLELRATQDGVIWPRRPLISSSGLLSCIKNLPFSAYEKKSACFRAVTFNCTGDVIAATDEKGRVFVFYVANNRYALVQHLGVPTITCCFSPTRKNELLVSCENETIRCIDVQSQTLISTLRGHRFPAHSASFQKSGLLALTASQDAVILWDTKDWSRYRVLNAGPGVEAATFVSRGDLVAVCFQDDSIMMWELESLALRSRFSLPEQEQPAHLHTIAVSDDYKVLVATGRTRNVYVWEFESQTILRIIELPLPIEQVVHFAFVSTQDGMISILGNDGSVFFLNVLAKRPKIQLEISHLSQSIQLYQLEHHGRYLAACTDDGCLLLYDMDIARETASRAYDIRKKQGLLELEDALRLRTRSILDGQVLRSSEEKSVLGSGGTGRRSSSKLIDGLFGPSTKRDVSADGKKQTIPSRESTTTKHLSRHHIITTNIDTAVNQQQAHLKPKKNLLTTRNLSQDEIAINRKRLEGSLRCNGKYPPKYRVLVWRFLLQLPKNERAFDALLRKGQHPAFIRLKEQYPLKNRRLERRLQRVLSAIAYWCPAFGEVRHLPAVVFPFIKMYRENDLAAFETCISILLHWCLDFVVNLPYPPVFILNTLEKQLEQIDPQLYDHFIKYNVNSEKYAWSLLKTLFTEVLSEEEWMTLWDYLFTSPDKPWLLQVAVLAYLSYFRTALLAAKDRYSIEQFFHQQNALRMDSFIQLMTNLSRAIDLSHENIRDKDETYWPLPKGQYPAFARYPKFIVDFEISERNRIALEEAELVQKKRLLERIQQEGEKLKREHQAWLDQRQKLILAEEARRAEAIASEKHRIISLKTVDYETRKRRLERIAELEKMAQESLEGTSKLFAAENIRLDSELKMMKERAEFEISSRMQEEELQRLEFETERRVVDIHKQNEMEERVQQLRAEFITRIKQHELDDLLKFESWKRNDENTRRKAKVDLERREKLTLLQQEKNVRQQIENKLLDHILATEKGRLEAQTRRDARVTEEREYQALDDEIEARERDLAELNNHPEVSRNKQKQGQGEVRTRDVGKQNNQQFHPETKRRNQKQRQSIQVKGSKQFTDDGELSNVLRPENDVESDYNDTNDVSGSIQLDDAFHSDSPVDLTNKPTPSINETLEGPHSNQLSPSITSVKIIEENSHVNDKHEIFADDVEANMNNNLDLLAKARRRLSTLLNESSDDESENSSENSSIAQPIERSKEEMTLLERALAEISSNSSSDGDVSKASSTRGSLVHGREEVEKAVASLSQKHIVETAQVSRPESLPDLESVDDAEDDSELNQPTLNKLLSHQQVLLSKSGDSSQDSENSGSLLQRPIEELEKELGIQFDLSSDEDDSDDDQLDDDRVRLLERAKKLLQEQSLNVDESDDDV